MFTNRLPKLIIITTLIIVAIAAFWTIKTFAESEASAPAYSDAEYHNSIYVGMGDLRRFEATQNAGEPESTHPVGMGDLRRFEAMQNAGEPASAHPAGMGDLQRLEATQEIEYPDIP